MVVVVVVIVLVVVLSNNSSLIGAFNTSDSLNTSSYARIYSVCFVDALLTIHSSCHLDVRKLNTKCVFFVFGKPCLHFLLFILTRFFYHLYRSCNIVVRYLLQMGLLDTVVKIVAHNL